MIILATQTSFAKKPYILLFFRGGGPNPLSPTSDSAHDLTRIWYNQRQIQGTCTIRGNHQDIQTHADIRTHALKYTHTRTYAHAHTDKHKNRKTAIALHTFPLLSSETTAISERIQMTRSQFHYRCSTCVSNTAIKTSAIH